MTLLNKTVRDTVVRFLKSAVFFAVAIHALLSAGYAAAANWHVDAGVTSPGDGTSRQSAFKTIQEGMDASSGGDTVIVAPGTYVENVKFKGKNVVLTSTNSSDPSVVASTIIDGNKAGSVVAFAGTETEACVLSGFTIQNGKADYGGGVCGGTPYLQTLATIRNNVITENRADKG